MSRRADILCIGLVAALCPGAATAAAQKSEDDLGARPHKGVLVQAGAGVGWSRHDNDWGLSLPSLTLGTYARRNLVIAAHFAGATHQRGLIGSHPYAFALGLYGPMVQMWWRDRIYLGLGCGLGWYNQHNKFSRIGWVDTISGFGLMLKLGVTAWHWSSGRVNGFVEALPAVFGDELQVSTIAGAEWQLP